MGEIGIPSATFRTELRWWEVKAIIEGYNRRERSSWSQTRWHAYNIMAAMPYVDLQKAGIFNPTDLIKFPWENIKPPVSNDDVQQAVAEMQAINRAGGIR